MAGGNPDPGSMPGASSGSFSFTEAPGQQLPPTDLSAGQGGATPGVAADTAPTPADNFNLSIGGALDLKAMPSQIAPLDQVSTQRIASHAGLGDVGTPPLSPVDKSVPDVPPAQPTVNQRYDYAEQLQNGDTTGPQHFAEKTVAGAWNDATWTDPNASWSDHAAQVTNAAKSLSTALPEPTDLDTYAAYLSQQNLGHTDPTAVQGIKGNLLDTWSATGIPIPQIVQAADSNPEAAQQLTTPPPPPATHFPTLEELSVPGRDAIQDPLGSITTDPTGLGGLIHLPAQELANQAKVGEMRDAKNPDGTPKFTQAQIFDQTMESPLVQFAAQLMGGKFLHMGITSDVATNAASYLTDAAKGTLKDTSGQLKPGLSAGLNPEPGVPNPEELNQRPGLGHNGGPSFGAIIRSVTDDLSFAQAKDVTEGRLGTEARIRYNVGDATREKALAKVTLEAHRQAVEPLVPSYMAALKDFQAEQASVAQQKSAWVAGGGNPAAFTNQSVVAGADTATNRFLAHPLQVLIDHMEDRPGGGRVAPNSPLHDLATEMSRIMEERKGGLINDVSDTMGFWEDYVPHNWVDPKQLVNKAFSETYGTGRQGSGYHIQERSLPYHFDGLMRGLTPKFPNPIDNALHYVQSIDDFRAAERIRKQAIEHDDFQYAPVGQQPAGYVALDGRAATRQRSYIDQKTGKAAVINEQLYAPPGAATIYNNWLSKGINGLPGAWGKYGGLLYDKWMAAKNASIGMSFGLSGFHPFVMWTHSFGNAIGEGMEHLRRGEMGSALYDLGIAPVALGRDYLAGRRQSSVYMNSGKNATSFENAFADMWAKAGGQAPHEGRGDAYFSGEVHNLLSRWNQAGAWGLNNIKNPVGRGLAKTVAAPLALTTEAGKMLGKGLAAPMLNETEGALKNTLLTVPRAFDTMLQTIGAVTNTVGHPLFDELIPNAKRGVVFDHMEAWVRQHPLADPHETLAEARRTMDRVENTFGEMNLRNVFWPTWSKQIANMLTVSMGWEYGTARWGMQTGQDLATAPTSAGRFSQNTRSLLGYILATGLFGTAYQYFKTGLTPFSTGVQNFWLPETRPNDPSSEIQFPGEQKEIIRAIALFKQAGLDPTKLAQVPFQYWGGKGNAIVGDVKAFLGAKNTQDFLKHIASDHAPSISWNDSPSANLAPFEKFMGLHSAPAVLTGASPTTIRQTRDAAGSNRPVYSSTPRERHRERE